MSSITKLIGEISSTGQTSPLPPFQKFHLVEDASRSKFGIITEVCRAHVKVAFKNDLFGIWVTQFSPEAAKQDLKPAPTDSVAGWEDMHADLINLLTRFRRI